MKLASPDSASPFTLPGNQAPIDTAKPVELSLRGAEIGRESLRQPRRRPDEKGSENRIVKQRAMDKARYSILDMLNRQGVFDAGIGGWLPLLQLDGAQRDQG